MPDVPSKTACDVVLTGQARLALALEGLVDGRERETRMRVGGRSCGRDAEVGGISENA